MKIETDQIRQAFIKRGFSKGHAIGKANNLIVSIMRLWVANGLTVSIVWGPPGSGKSHTLNSVHSGGQGLTIETTGMNRAFNKAVRDLPQEQVSYVLVIASRKVCKERLAKRITNPMGNKFPLDYLVDKWYNEATEAFPVDAEIKT